MDEFIVINVMNEARLKLLKDKNANYEINLKIKEILKDEAIFFKISKEKAFTILQNVAVKAEQLEKVYKKLTTPNKFYELLNNGKIKVDDENLVVKYNLYNKNNLFKKGNQE